MSATEEDFTRVKRDTNGNPRYVIHFLQCMPNTPNFRDSNRYANTCSLMNEIGGAKYRAKSYGGGVVFQSYNLKETVKTINELIRKEESA